MDNTKIIEIIDPQKGLLKETVIETPKPVADPEKPAGEIVFGESLDPMQENQAMLKELGLSKYQSFREAAGTSEFPSLLRLGFKQILFNTFNDFPTTYQDWVQVTTSDKQGEDYLEMNSLGVLPTVPEGTLYPEVGGSIDRAVRIANNKKGMIFAITREMIKFDKTNQMKQFPQDLGRSAKQTLEADCYSVLTTSGNYVRNSTTNDNDVGANTAATTFSATGLLTALRTLRTMKDRKSGRYFGIQPNTLLVTPGLEFAAKQLLMSADVQRAHGNTSVEVYGTGTSNPFRGVVNKIIVSPWVGTTYEWVLMEPKMSVVMQQVEPLQLLVESVTGVQNEAYFLYDVIRYRVSLWYGVGMLNDRYAYLSTATAAPAVA